MTNHIYKKQLSLNIALPQQPFTDIVNATKMVNLL